MIRGRVWCYFCSCCNCDRSVDGIGGLLAAWCEVVSLVLERFDASFLQIHAPLQVVAGRFEVQREGGARNSHAAHKFSAHGRIAPKTCSIRARCVAMRRLHSFCVAEIGLLTLPLRWICTRQPAAVSVASRSALG